MQPKSQFSSGYSAHKASAPRSPTAQFEELNYSTQAMQPKSQFSSGSLAHKASAPRSPAAQFDELDYSTPAMRPKSQFNSSRIAHKASTAQFAELFSSGRPQRPRSLSDSIMKSSTVQLRPCGSRASSAQAK